MRKLLVTIGTALLMTGAALAQSQPYNSTVLVTADIGGTISQRYYHPTFDQISPAGADACAVASQTISGWDATNRACLLKFFSSANGKGYRGYLEDIVNDGKPAGDVRYAVFDAETGTGTASHAGYYFFAGKAVNVNETSKWFASGCTGTDVITCLGQGNTTNSAGTGIANTPLGALNPKDGFRPIPVPLATSVNKATGDMTLSWSAASDVNGNGQVSYDIFGVAKSSCTAPLASEYTGGIRNVVGTSTVVNVSAFGNTPSTPACYYFAIKIKYPNAGVNAVRSLNFSANSQGIVFGGLAATVTNIEAKLMGRSGVAVTWKTSLEDGVKGFYVTRSFTATGTFERVSGLIAAKGQPSTYSYIDSAIPTLPAKGDGIYYKIETSDIDNNIASYGPVKADLGAGKGQVNQPRQQNHR